MRFWAMVCLGCVLPQALAQVSLQNSHCYAQESAWFVDAQWSVQLPAAPLAALKSGIPLYFTLTAEHSAEHWWQSATLLAKQTWQVHYNHLSFAYVLQKEHQVMQRFSDLNSALKALGTIERLPLSVASSQAPIVLRLHLSQEQLPFSLRLNALLSQEWALDSGRWQCQQ